LQLIASGSSGFLGSATSGSVWGLLRAAQPLPSRSAPGASPRPADRTSRPVCRRGADQAHPRPVLASGWSLGRQEAGRQRQDLAERRPGRAGPAGRAPQGVGNPFGVSGAPVVIRLLRPSGAHFLFARPARLTPLNPLCSGHHEWRPILWLYFRTSGAGVHTMRSSSRRSGG
jgi:hypothetical protein